MKTPPSLMAAAMQRAGLVLFGLTLALLLLEAILWGGHFCLRGLQHYRNRTRPDGDGAYRILCIGESTTRGQYPALLEQILNERRGAFRVIDGGIGGSNSSAIIAALEDGINRYRPHMIVAMMGINDDGNVVPWHRGRRNAWWNRLRVYRLSLLAREHLAGGRTTEERVLLRATERDRNAWQAYHRLGVLYGHQGRNAEAERMLRAALELNPGSPAARSDLGFLYWRTGEDARAEEAYRRTIRLTDSDALAYVALADICEKRGDLDEAERMFRGSLERGSDVSYFINAARFYRRHGRAREAERIFMRGLSSAPRSDRTYGALAIHYLEQGDDAAAGRCFRKAEAARGAAWPPALRDNYRKLATIAEEAGIRLVCMQYPVRSIQPLRRVLEGLDGIVFVDNERVFKDAVKRESYDAVFKDQFAGDFGHCTGRGNRLMAENLADAILREFAR